MALITCEDVTFSYEGNDVINHVSFTVEQGDYLCIVGENGSGKSTLMKGLLGLKQQKRGTITFGEGLSRKDIGYLPQQTPIQKDFPAGVLEVVLSGCLNQRGFHPFYRKEQKAKAMASLEALHIEDLKDRCYRELSGGQQQRVLLARALCAADRLLLLDEPVTGLDPLVTEEFYDLIDKINHEMGMTVIMVSHDLHFALRSADHILHLSQDTVFFGNLDSYLHSDCAEHFLGREIHV
ncbi:MAG: ABC transporter ATP-binding protein [Firmicutes bacterium]|nr:ABC transporter ATP-binding protein [Bacillota bacterium]